MTELAASNVWPLYPAPLGTLQGCSSRIASDTVVLIPVAVCGRDVRVGLRLPLSEQGKNTVPYIQSGKDHRIEPATVDDLRSIFEAGGRIGVEVGHDDGQTLQATIFGGSALILHLDHNNGQSRKPAGNLDRDQTLSVLERFLESKELDPDCDWIEVGLPSVKTRGCRKSATMLLLIAVLTLGGLFAAIGAL